MGRAAQLSAAVLLSVAFLWGDEPAPTYLLGPEDQIEVSLRGVKEIEFKPARIDEQGDVELHYVGKLHAAGLTAGQLAARIADRLKEFVNDPMVTVEVTEFGSQPVSVMGAVNKPGVYQLRGHKTLIEVLSMAEGMRNDAGYIIKVTRAREWGPIPLATSASDETGQYSVAEVSVKSIIDGKSPQANILMRPHDVISVPRGEMVYVVGSVKRPGGFMLGEKESLSVLQAISLAEGLDTTAAPQNAKIIRSAESSSQRLEIAVNVKRILSSKEQDRPLQANDILFVPNSASKSVAIRTAEAAVEMATGIAIYRR
jgi:polysaccharide export outer membrane protein